MHRLLLLSLCLSTSACVIVIKSEEDDAPVAAAAVEAEPVARPGEPATPGAMTTNADVAMPVPPKAPSAGDSEAMLAQALDFLAGLQREDGSWPEGDEPWMAEVQRAGGDAAGGLQARAANEAGRPAPHAVGVTALCVLALAQSPEHAERVARGRAWLFEQQEESGAFRSSPAHDFLYGHGIATFALIETMSTVEGPVEGGRLQMAIDFIHRARNPYAAWRYDVPPIGDNDTSVTGWMLAALASARDAGFRVDTSAFEGGLSWLDEVTDPQSGRVGYDTAGGLSSRTPQNEHFAREHGEAMTAVGLASRVEVAGAERGRDTLASYARLLKRNLPTWEPDMFGVDMYYWYHGTRGMRALGGADWEVWRAAMLSAALDGQRDDPKLAGSWDPIGPWGYTGGRAYATALMALSVGGCLER